MISLRSTVLAVASLLIMAAAMACTDPADPIALGEICQPETDDCPRSVDLHRDGVGRNLLDFDLAHGGDGQGPAAQSEVRLRVTTADADLDPPDQRAETDDGRLILFEQDYAPGPGEVIREQLGAHQLTVTSRIRLELDCLTDACNHRLEYIYFADAIECIDDGVCGRSEFCEEAYGRCAECQSDAGCSEEQSCLRESGQCFPGDNTGCQSTSSTPPSGLVGPGIAIGLLLLFVAVRRRRRWQRLIVRTGVVGLAVAATLVSTPNATFADSGASMNVGAGMRVLTGEAGELTAPGWGFNVNQQLRWHHIGAIFELSTNSFGLRGDAYPQGARLSGYGITVGPRGFVPLPFSIPRIAEDEPFELVAGLDYSQWNVAENRLASLTGLGLRYHAAGPTLGINWRWGGLAVTARGHYSHIFNWPGGVISFDLLFGIGP